VNSKSDSENTKMQIGRKILVVGEEGLFSESLIDYAVQVAKRLNYDILALSVIQKDLGELTDKSNKYNKLIEIKAVSCGVGYNFLIRSGDTGVIVEKIIHEVKRIEFVITGSDESKEKIAAEVTIPVFSVFSNNNIKGGGKTMAREINKKKPVGKVLGYGAISVALYAAVFTNADTVTNYFTRGGWYAALPILTVFVFTFAHATFASNLWSLLGISAAHKDIKVVTIEKSAQDDVRTTKVARKRPRARAYINPFHRI